MLDLSALVTAIIIMSCGAIALGFTLGYIAVKFRVEGNPLADQICDILPQTQCGQCGYPGCRPYADAIATGEADFNQCVPGGDDGVQLLADLLGKEFKPLSEEYGLPKPPSIAKIDESTCIGCTLCIQACPVDAIVGAPKQMHTVVADLCTGCELCLPPCPVECIELIAISESVGNWKWKYPQIRLKQIIATSSNHGQLIND